MSGQGANPKDSKQSNPNQDDRTAKGAEQNAGTTNGTSPSQGTPHDEMLAAGSSHGSAETKGLRRVTVASELTTFIAEDLASLKLNHRDKAEARRYLLSLDTTDPEKLQNGVNVVTAAVEIMGDRKPGAKISVGQLIRTAADLELRPREMRELAVIATKQGRSLARVGKFMEELAAAPRTDDERNTAFKEATPEQRDRVIEEGLDVMLAVKLYEATWGTTISLKLIAQLTRHASSDEVIRQLEVLDDASLAGTPYENYRDFGKHGIILGNFAKWLDLNPGAPFSVEAFLDDRRKTSRLQRYSDED
jgi:hypothetical protein